jgi:hypothetical protein
MRVSGRKSRISQLRANERLTLAAPRAWRKMRQKVSQGAPASKVFRNPLIDDWWMLSRWTRPSVESNPSRDSNVPRCAAVAFNPTFCERMRSQSPAMSRPRTAARSSSPWIAGSSRRWRRRSGAGWSGGRTRRRGRLRACTHKIAIGDSDVINVRFCPLCGLKSDISRGPRSANSGCEQSQQIALLFDDLVGAGEQGRRHLEAECPRRDQVDNQIELGRLLDWQVGGFGPT